MLRRRLRPQQEHRGHDEDHRRAGQGHLGGAQQDERNSPVLAAAASQPRVEVVRRGAEQVDVVVCGDEVAGAAEEAGEVGAGAESEAGEFIRRGAD